jgi:multisubunit Na+/H+ antiporter MnhE subunit
MPILMVLQVVAVVLLAAIASLAIVTAGIKVAEKILKDKEKGNDNR